MHKRFGFAVIMLIAAALLFIPGLFDRCLTFLLIGVVPYTNIILSPTTMLVMYAVFLSIGVYAIANQLFIATNPVKRDIVGRNKARRKVHTLTKNRRATSHSHVKKHYQSVTQH